MLHCSQAQEQGSGLRAAGRDAGILLSFAINCELLCGRATTLQAVAGKWQKAEQDPTLE